MTLRKYVSKHKNMRKLMIEILRKFENRSIKIAQVNSIINTKSINLQSVTIILYCFRVHCDLRLFSVLSPFIEKSMIVLKTTFHMNIIGGIILFFQYYLY